MAKQNQQPEKRPLDDDTESTDKRIRKEEQWNDHSWPRFIVLESANPGSSLAKLSPFAIHKGILGIAGAVTEIKKL